jgi:hypothetical protein
MLPFLQQGSVSKVGRETEHLPLPDRLDQLVWDRTRLHQVPPTPSISEVERKALLLLLCCINKTKKRSHRSGTVSIPLSTQPLVLSKITEKLNLHNPTYQQRRNEAGLDCTLVFPSLPVVSLDPLGIWTSPFTLHPTQRQQGRASQCSPFPRKVWAGPSEGLNFHLPISRKTVSAIVLLLSVGPSKKLNHISTWPSIIP